MLVSLDRSNKDHSGLFIGEKIFDWILLGKEQFVYIIWYEPAEEHKLVIRTYTEAMRIDVSVPTRKRIINCKWSYKQVTKSTQKMS